MARCGQMRHSSHVFELFAWVVLLLAPADQPCLILGAIDQSRTHAYARADPDRLAALYSSEAVARPDVDVLESYRERDVRVVSMQVERDSCTPWKAGVVRVVERLAGADVELSDGTKRALPSGEWKKREVRLVYDGRWRIASTKELAEYGA